MGKTRGARIAVLGSSGMLGSALQYVLRESGHDVFAFDRRSFEIASHSVDTIDVSGYDYVINAAGVINRRFSAEQPQSDALLVNSLFPRLLADRCEAAGVRLVHISTDCVFAGTSGPYSEVDPAGATDGYGRSKYLGEPRNCLVLRTSIIGPERERFYSLLCWFLSQEGECRGYVNHRWNGMTSVQLSHCIDRIVQTERYEYRVQHLYSEETTKYDLLVLINRVFDKRIRVIRSDDMLARDTRLSSTDAAFVEALRIPSLDKQLTELLPLCDERGRWLPRLLNRDAAAGAL